MNWLGIQKKASPSTTVMSLEEATGRSSAPASGDSETASKVALGLSVVGSNPGAGASPDLPADGPLAGVAKPSAPALPAKSRLGRNGLHIAAFDEVETEEDFEKQGIRFTSLKKLGDKSARPFQVAPHLEGRVVPVSCLEKPFEVWLFCVSAACESDDVRDVADALEESKYVLKSPFSVVPVSPTLLIEVSRSEFSPSSQRARRGDAAGDLLLGFQGIVQWAYDEGASDIDFRVLRGKEKSFVAFAIHGQWVSPERFVMGTSMMEKFLSVAYQHGKGSSEGAIDFKQEQQLYIFLNLRDRKKVKLRWASMAGDDIYTVTFRVTEVGGEKNMSLEQLGYEDEHIQAMERALNSDGGAVVYAGRVNSGKSTSIGAMLERIPPTRKVVTFEDPVENDRGRMIANTVSRPLSGEDSPILRAKMRSLKRSALNDFFLGEIRDQETAEAAQDALQSGQRLFTTVHTSEAWKIPERLIELGVAREVVASPGSLLLLAYQALIPKLCQHCALPFDSLYSSQGGARDRWRNYGDRLTRLYELDLAPIKVRNPEGCKSCRREGMPELNGLRGRAAAVEMLEPDDEFCELVSRGKSMELYRYVKEMRERGASCGVTHGGSALDSAVRKMAMGMLDPREVESRFRSFESIELQAQRRRPTNVLRAVEAQ